MRKHFGLFTLFGMQWEVFIDNNKTKAAERLYILDSYQSEINICSQPKGCEASYDKQVETLLRAIVALILRFMHEEEDFGKDEYITPFGSFLHQFICTDTFDGKSGNFSLGGTQWMVVNDKTYTFHRDVNGECDSNIGRIILELIDPETSGPKILQYIRHIYIHEVTHAILCQMGKKHEEKFVCVKGAFLYEALSSLVLIQDNKEVHLWTVKSFMPIDKKAKLKRK